MLCSDHGFHPDHLRPRHIPAEPAGPAAEHRPFGIFAARGPGLRQDAVIHGASLLDMCLKVLHALGLPVGENGEKGADPEVSPLKNKAKVRDRPRFYPPNQQ